MNLRKFKSDDAPFIFEWMKDPTINRFFRFDALSITIESIYDFINTAQDTSRNMHLACTDENDIYLGTISLKNINLHDKIAEYAVSFRSIAQGTGAASFATQEILRIAFTELQLEKVYLNVLENNKRAITFYEKQGFILEGVAVSHIIQDKMRRDLRWYRILKGEWMLHNQKSKNF